MDDDYSKFRNDCEFIFYGYAITNKFLQMYLNLIAISSSSCMSTLNEYQEYLLDSPTFMNDIKAMERSIEFPIQVICSISNFVLYFNIFGSTLSIYFTNLNL